MIKAVLFDLDNTLIDFMKVKRSSVDAAIDAMLAAGVKVRKKKAEKILYSLYKQHGIEHQQIFQKFLRVVLGKISYKALAEGIIAYRKTQVGILLPYSDVIPTLTKLRRQRLKLAIVSDAPRLKAWIRLVELGIQDHFDVVVCHEDTGHYKHTGLPFKKALRLLKLKPDDCLMVGDWPERDIVGAKKLGIRTVFARYGTTKKISNSGADFEIDSVTEVAAVVKKLNARNSQQRIIKK
ncbi:TIGR02253 family HAD-type hydrolase [Candidatus Woesearchaeota archaeon]|nr:TIGR02253 family HAD-type hydrolase [Candidatus Woesearchaeota archaeon]